MLFRTPIAASCFMNATDGCHLKSKRDAGVVNFSLVCEENSGESTKSFTTRNT